MWPLFHPEVGKWKEGLLRTGQSCPISDVYLHQQNGTLARKFPAEVYGSGFSIEKRLLMTCATEIYENWRGCQFTQKSLIYPIVCNVR